MIWWLVVLGIFVAIAAAMYVPNWVRWARWNRKRRKATPGEQQDMIAPVPPPFWSSYGGAYVGTAGLGGGSAAFSDGGGGDAGFGAGAGFDGGGGDGGGGD